MKKNNTIKLIVLTVLTVIVYLPTLIWMWDRWFTKDSYYGHGILIPLVSLYILWQNKERIKKIKTNPSNLGLVLIIIGLIIHLVSALLRVYFTSGFSLLLVIPGLVLYLYGSSMLDEVKFPIAFLFFMIPLPLEAVANISLKMKLFAAQASTTILNRMNIPALRDGSTIKMMHAYLIVGDPCSGLRSLISLLALGALFAYFLNTTTLKKIILFVCSAPIALISNIVRILALALVGEIYGQKYTHGFFHDFMGMMVFVIAFIGLTVIAKVLENKVESSK